MDRQSEKSIFFDAHTHVQFQAFAGDYKEAVGRALSSGVGMVNVGTQKDTSRRAVEIAHEYENEKIFAAVGLHPIHTGKSFHDEDELGLPRTDADDTQTDAENFQRKSALNPHGSASAGFWSRAEEFDHEYYKKLALDPKVVAVGECGLDYYRATSDMGQATWNEMKAKQRQVLGAQIQLAREIKKPLMLHCRDGKKSGTGPAFDDLVNILESHAAGVPFVSHSFVRNLGLAKKLLDLGSYFSFNGIITFTHDYDEVVRFLPVDRILSETDAPYLAPVPHRGKRNEPAYVVEVVKKMAEIRGLSIEKMAEQIRENTGKIFGLRF